MVRQYIRQAYRLALPLLYAKSNYKLFLKESLLSVNDRLRQLATASDYFSGTVRPIPIRAPFGESLLVIAPHQDDEAIGCGGALALQVRAGKNAEIVMVHDGADGCEEIGFTRKQLMDLRNEESQRAAAVLGLKPPQFLNHADLLADADKIVRELRDTIIRLNTDVIMTPYMLDGHRDHRVTADLVARALAEVPREIRVLCYEVWGLCIPNVIVVIDEVIEQKVAMIECFKFANEALDYVGSTKGLNMYHSRLLAAGMCRYAECFFELPSTAYIELMAALKTQAAGSGV